ncbi:hypothetical protein [Streptomyces aureocirculatus]|uniref:hypothetical protein n=1 Tax=Streptomyces aureocirculatus TaxID=67275 RepID=UPI0004C87BD9|nr:hypothetical protein [Streptomyces aureocirculatus]
MATCIIHDETDEGWAELVEQLHDISDRVTPALQDCTGLGMGPKPVIRLLDSDRLVSQVNEDQRRALDRDIALYALDAQETAGLRASMHAREKLLSETWMLATGYTAANKRGAAEILIAPQTLRHAGFREPQMTKLVAHEFCSVARHQAGQGALHRVVYSPCPERHHLLPDAYPAFVAYGFAEWANREVTSHLLGEPVVPGNPTGYETRQFMQQVAGLQRRIGERDLLLPGADTVWLPARADFPMPPPAVYIDGAKWIADVVNRTGGVTLVNHMWAQPSLIPTLGEIADPGLWVARAEQATDAAGAAVVGGEAAL